MVFGSVESKWLSLVEALAAYRMVFFVVVVLHYIDRLSLHCLMYVGFHPYCGVYLHACECIAPGHTPCCTCPSGIVHIPSGGPIKIFMLTYARTTTHQLLLPALVHRYLTATQGELCEKKTTNRFLKDRVVKFEAYHTHTHTVENAQRWNISTRQTERTEGLHCR